MVMGSDKVLQLFDPRWYQDREAALERLFARARLLYADRAGTEGAVGRVLARRETRRWRDRVVPLEPSLRVAGVSSRMVRELVRRGEEVEGLIPEEAREAVARAARSERERGG